jgi:hypothetical protein
MWVLTEMVNPTDKHGKDMAITINSEFTDEVAKTLKENGLEVEVK